MRVAIYACVKNENKDSQLYRWIESASEADYLLAVDTGSTDGTPGEIQQLLEGQYRDGGEVLYAAITPWRFDVAKNTALSLVPPLYDVCIQLDPDERLQPGWRGALEKAWVPGTTRGIYNYVWNWNADGSRGLQFQWDKIHARNGYVWRFPTHEALYPYQIQEHKVTIEGLEIHQFPGPKNKSQDLGLLELAVQESPCPRTLFYLAREYVYQRRGSEARLMLSRFLAHPEATWAPQRAHALRLMSETMEWGGNGMPDLWALGKAIEIAPEVREGWLDLAEGYLKYRMPGAALDAASQGLKITTRSDYFEEPRAWGPRLQEIVDQCQR